MGGSEGCGARMPGRGSLVGVVAWLCVAASAELGPVRTPFDHFSKQSFPSGTIVSGGRLVRRHLNYLAAAGFKSVVSVVPFQTDTTYNGVPGDWLSSADQVAACEAAGMQAIVFDWGNGTAWNVDAAMKVDATLVSMPKPLYIHCHVGYSAALFAQLHHILQGRASIHTFFSDSRNVGWDFQSDPTAVTLVANVTHTAAVPVSAPSIDLDLNGVMKGYEMWYWSHRLGGMDGFYNVGQVLSTQVSTIAASGYKSVICFRTDGEDTVRLPTDPAVGPIANWEFSDPSSGAWNASMERAAFEAACLSWHHAPVGGAGAFTPAQFDSYMHIFEQAAAMGPTLVHCKTGYRSSIYTLAFLARKGHHCSEWALTQAQQVGFNLTVRPEDAHARDFLNQVL